MMSLLLPSLWSENETTPKRPNVDEIYYVDLCKNVLAPFVRSLNFIFRINIGFV